MEMGDETFGNLQRVGVQKYSPHASLVLNLHSPLKQKNQNFQNIKITRYSFNPQECQIST